MGACCEMRSKTGSIGFVNLDNIQSKKTSEAIITKLEALNEEFQNKVKEIQDEKDKVRAK